jgi:uncharacterized protein (DUF2147 family)
METVMRPAFLLPLLAALLATPAMAHPAVNAAGAEGIWLNPKGTLAVHTDACGPGLAPALCGRIVWASPQAQADARDAEVPHLVGTQLLENYRPHGRGVWQGTVFVPDMGRRFFSQIEALSPDRLQIKGCILGGLLCKSQVWTRIAQVPA